MKKSIKNNFNASLIIICFLLNVSYIFVNINFPIMAESSFPIINMFINKNPIIMSSLSFLISSFLLFFIMGALYKIHSHNIFELLIIFFIIINPFSLKYIFLPGVNIIYSIIILFVFKIYYLLLNNKINIYWFSILLSPVCLIIPYTIIIITQIVIIDYLFKIFLKGENKKHLRQLFVSIMIICVLMLFLLNVNIQIFSDSVSNLYFSFLYMSLSVWLGFLLFSIIGFIFWSFLNIKKNFNLLNLFICIILIPIGCISFSFDSFNFPFIITLLGFSFFRIKNISVKYSHVLAILLTILTFSCFFSTLNNYKIQRLFIDNVIISIEPNLNEKSTYYVINNTPYSSILKHNSIYPKNYWDSLYLLNNTWQDIEKNDDVTFSFQNEDFAINKLSHDFYNFLLANDNRYYYIITKNGFSYIIFKKT